jgi:hypothetical protein
MQNDGLARLALFREQIKQVQRENASNLRPIPLWR